MRPPRPVQNGVADRSAIQVSRGCIKDSVGPGTLATIWAYDKLLKMLSVLFETDTHSDSK